jgi:hypothetical protein
MLQEPLWIDLDPCCPFLPHINKPLLTSKAIPTIFSSPAAKKLPSSQGPMAKRQIVPFGVDLNKKPDTLALSVIPP